MDATEPRPTEPELPDAIAPGPTELPGAGDDPGQHGHDEVIATQAGSIDARTPATGESSRCRVIAIASGKGGVGKSLLAASIGIYLAQLDRRVVLVDANLGAANLHTMVGLDDAWRSIHAFLRNEVKDLSEVISETPISGLGLIAGHGDQVGAANPRPTQKKRFLGQLRTLDADYVVVDIAAGSGFNALDTFLAADHQVVVTSPEPTAIEGTFRMIKSAFIRRVRDIRGVEPLLEQLQSSAHCGVPSPLSLQARASEHSEELAQAVRDAVSSFRPQLIVSQTRTREDLELGPWLAVIGRRHLGIPLEYVGYVESDELVWASVHRRRPLVVEYPDAKVSRDIERVVRRLLGRETHERGNRRALPIPLAKQNHYEILGLHAAASEEEIRAAHRRVQRIYADASAAIYGVVPKTDVKLFLSRVEQAYATLIDPDKRHAYNMSVYMEGPTTEPITNEASSAPLAIVPVREGIPEHTDATPAPRPEMPQIDATTAFTGKLLREIREAQGIKLQELSDHTKISVAYLDAIENENFLNTPAAVYLRGFVKAVAKRLKLNPDQVSNSFMQRYQARRASSGLENVANRHHSAPREGPSHVR